MRDELYEAENHVYHKFVRFCCPVVFSRCPEVRISQYTTCDFTAPFPTCGVQKWHGPAAAVAAADLYDIRRDV
jgi:hypothetical protein